jgi:hypothetical protein
MTIRQVTVPYRPGYNFGVSADLATGSPMGKVVEGESKKVQGAAGATVTFTVKRIQTTEELEEALGIDAEASYGCAAFGGGVSARFSFAKTSRIQTTSLFMIVTAQVELAFESIDDPKLSAAADSIVDRQDIFNQRYGNVFVRGIHRGGLFVGTFRMDTSNSEESTAISAELAGSYGLFSADVKQKFANIQKKYKCSTYIDMYHEGGPVDLKIVDFNDPRQLLDNANRFLESFRTESADSVAKPYFVTLAPVTLATSKNLPLNTAQIQKAQDILVACTKARSRIIDKINLLDFIQSNESRYSFPPGLDGQSLNSVRGAFEEDLDLVADCASAAINSPGEAKFPKVYADHIGRQYPTGALPAAMPLPRAGKAKTVPDFLNCKTWKACNDLAVSSGLQAQQDIQHDQTPGAFKVLSVVPSVGEDVPEGASITIRTRPTAISLIASIPLQKILAQKALNRNIFD